MSLLTAVAILLYLKLSVLNSIDYYVFLVLTLVQGLGLS